MRKSCFFGGTVIYTAVTMLLFKLECLTPAIIMAILLGPIIVIGSLWATASDDEKNTHHRYY